MLLALAEDPTTAEPLTMAYLKNLDPLYQEATKGLLQIFIIRLRPYTQQGPAGAAVAGTYVDAVLDGALRACTKGIERRMESEPN